MKSSRWTFRLARDPLQIEFNKAVGKRGREERREQENSERSRTCGRFNIVPYLLDKTRVLRWTLERDIFKGLSIPHDVNRLYFRLWSFRFTHIVFISLADHFYANPHITLKSIFYTKSLLSQYLHKWVSNMKCGWPSLKYNPTLIPALFYLFHNIHHLPLQILIRPRVYSSSYWKIEWSLLHN